MGKNLVIDLTSCVLGKLIAINVFSYTQFTTTWYVWPVRWVKLIPGNGHYSSHATLSDISDSPCVRPLWFRTELHLNLQKRELLQAKLSKSHKVQQFQQNITKNEKSLVMSKQDGEICTCGLLLWNYTDRINISIYSSRFLIWKPVCTTCSSDNFQDIFKTIHCWSRWGSEGFILPTWGIYFWGPLKIFAINQPQCMIHDKKLALSMRWAAPATSYFIRCNYFWLGALGQCKSLGWLKKPKNFLSYINIDNAATSS